MGLDIRINQEGKIYEAKVNVSYYNLEQWYDWVFSQSSSDTKKELLAFLAELLILPKVD